MGNAGSILIEAPDGRVVFDNGDVFSDVQENAVGESGSIRIATGYLALINGGQLQVDTSGEGSAGNIFIEAPDGRVVFRGSIVSHNGSLGLLY